MQRTLIAALAFGVCFEGFSDTIAPSGAWAFDEPVASERASETAAEKGQAGKTDHAQPGLRAEVANAEENAFYLQIIAKSGGLYSGDWLLDSSLEDPQRASVAFLCFVSYSPSIPAGGETGFGLLAGGSREAIDFSGDIPKGAPAIVAVRLPALDRVPRMVVLALVSTEPEPWTLRSDTESAHEVRVYSIRKEYTFANSEWQLTRCSLNAEHQIAALTTKAAASDDEMAVRDVTANEAEENKLRADWFSDEEQSFFRQVCGNSAEGIRQAAGLAEPPVEGLPHVHPVCVYFLSYSPSLQARLRTGLGLIIEGSAEPPFRQSPPHAAPTIGMARLPSVDGVPRVTVISLIAVDPQPWAIPTKSENPMTIQLYSVRREYAWSNEAWQLVRSNVNAEHGIALPE